MAEADTMAKKQESWTPPKGVAFYVEPITHKSFRPYAKAIGEAALAWNALHKVMASMFWMLLGSDKGKEAAAIWNVLENDRLQRKMLWELAKATLFKIGMADGIQQQKLDNVDWIINE